MLQPRNPLVRQSLPVSQPTVSVVTTAEPLLSLNTFPITQVEPSDPRVSVEIIDSTDDMPPKEEAQAIELELEKNPSRSKKAKPNRAVYKIIAKPGVSSLAEDLIELANSWTEGEPVLYDFECFEAVNLLCKKHKLSV